MNVTPVILDRQGWTTAPLLQTSAMRPVQPVDLTTAAGQGASHGGHASAASGSDSRANGKLEVLNANIQKELFNQETFFDLGSLYLLVEAMDSPARVFFLPVWAVPVLGRGLLALTSPFDPGRTVLLVLELGLGVYVHWRRIRGRVPRLTIYQI